jgi:nitric oxide reductase large subunit
MLSLLACGAGIYAGLHFNVLAVLPLSVLGAGAYVVTSWSNGHGLLSSLAAMFLPIIAVQVGYFLGVTTRPVYAHLRARFNIRHSERA